MLLVVSSHLLAYRLGSLYHGLVDLALQIEVLVSRDGNSQGVQVHDVVAKPAGLDEVRKEGDCYDNFVARLNPADTPRKLATLEFGTHTLAGVFFGLADGFDEAAFDIAKHAPERAGAMIGNIESATARWVAEVPETRITIKQVRQRSLGDEPFEDIRRTFGLDWVPDSENREIQTRGACIHGDLHGYNVLVSADGAIVLIDYDDVGEGPASVDPVTLELSFLFHPNVAGAAGSWPSADQAIAWGDLEAYLVDCPFPEFIRKCRQWALRSLPETGMWQLPPTAICSGS